MSINNLTLTHQCPKNGCTKAIKHHQYACRNHWYEISKSTRNRIWKAWEAADISAHVQAMADAQAELNAKENA